MFPLLSESEMVGIKVHDECESSEASSDVSVPVPPEIGVVPSKVVVSLRQCLDLTLCVIRFVKSAVGSPQISKVGSFVGCHRCSREHLTTWEHLTTFIMCEI